MRFSYILPALSALTAFASAQTAGGPNSFMIPMPAGYTLTAGQPTTFTWDNLSGSTVTLKLRDGASSNLNAGTTIVGMYIVYRTETSHRNTNMLTRFPKPVSPIRAPSRTRRLRTPRLAQLTPLKSSMTKTRPK